MEYRKATEQDIGILCRIRKQQLIDEGISPSIDIDAELERYFTDKLKDGSLIEWLLVDNETVIATAAIVFMEFPPTYTNKSGIKGYITNMYTAPEYRGQGIATSMLDRLIAEARQRSVHKIWLGASRLGRPVYRKFGFNESSEWMELNL